MEKLIQRLETVSNDYSPLEKTYQALTGSDLIDYPYTSLRASVPEITLSVSIVVPSFNSQSTIEQCLTAIEQSSFHRKHPNKLEVVVVDDGSQDGTWKLLEQMNLHMHVKRIRQTHCGPSLARNTGIKYAEGEIIIFCDSDIILSFFCIEEMLKRHQVFPNILSMGFREDVEMTDPRVQLSAIKTALPAMFTSFVHDVRLCYPAGVPYKGWPENIFLATNHLKHFGNGRGLFMSTGGFQTLPMQVWGCIMSMSRENILAIGGFSEQFKGWGWEDNLVAAEALARELYVLPIYAATGLHIDHTDRLPDKWMDFAINYQVYQNVLYAPFHPEKRKLAAPAEHLIQDFQEDRPDGTPPAVNTEYSGFEVYDAHLADPFHRATYMYYLGHYDEALQALSPAQALPGASLQTTLSTAKVLRALGQPQAIENHLNDKLAPSEDWPPEAFIETALTLVALNRFVEAQDLLKWARERQPSNKLLTYILAFPVFRHKEQASIYMRQELYSLAITEYEYALIQHPFDLAVQVERARALRISGQAAASLLAERTFLSMFDQQMQPLLERAWQAVATGNLGGATQIVEQARQELPDNERLMQVLQSIHTAASRLHPLPLHETILERAQEIPGDFTTQEIEFLIAVTSRVAHQFSGVLIELGCYCGQGTIVMGLTLQALGTNDTRIVAIDDPVLTPTREIARYRLNVRLLIHHLNQLVILVPEEETEPWRLSSSLILVHSRGQAHNTRNDVERYIPQLVDDGVLLLHADRAISPDLWSYAEEMLIDPRFTFVARAGNILAFKRSKRS